MQTAAEHAQRRNDTNHAPAVVEAGNTFAGAGKNHFRRAKGRVGYRSSGIIILPSARQEIAERGETMSYFAPTHPALETSITCSSGPTHLTSKYDCGCAGSVGVTDCRSFNDLPPNSLIRATAASTSSTWNPTWSMP